MSTVKSFVREVVARVKGDEPTVLAEKNYRKAINSIEAQLPVQKSELYQLEDEIATSNDELNNLKFPAEAITDGADYLRSVMSQARRVAYLEEKKETVENTIKFLEDLKVEYTAEVEA